MGARLGSWAVEGGGEAAEEQVGLVPGEEEVLRLPWRGELFTSPTLASLEGS